MGLFDLVEDIIGIAVAPVSIAGDLARTVTKPIADELKEIEKDVSDMVEDDY